MSDAALYALVLENNRMLKALTERLTPKAEPARWTLDGRLNDVSVPGETSPEQTLERLIRDAGAKSRWGYPSKPLTESDMAHVLKTGEVPPASSAAERLVRGQVADRLWAMLGVKAPVDPSLDAALAQVEHTIKYGGMSGSTVALLQSKTRDAALEEAVSAIPLTLPTGEYAETVERIRALKSKPAPTPAKQDLWTCGGCGESGTGFMPGRHEMRWCVEDAAKRAASPNGAGE